MSMKLTKGKRGGVHTKAVERARGKTNPGPEEFGKRTIRAFCSRTGENDSCLV